MTANDPELDAFLTVWQPTLGRLLDMWRSAGKEPSEAAFVVVNQEICSKLLAHFQGVPCVSDPVDEQQALVVSRAELAHIDDALAERARTDERTPVVTITKAGKFSMHFVGLQARGDLN
jgi:hypothetical protein